MEEILFERDNHYCYELNDQDALSTEYISRAAVLTLKKVGTIYLVRGNYALEMQKELQIKVSLMFPPRTQMKSLYAYLGPKRVELETIPSSKLFEYIHKFRTINIPPLSAADIEKYGRWSKNPEKDIKVQRLHILLNWFSNIKYEDLWFHETSNYLWLDVEMAKPNSKIIWGRKLKSSSGMHWFVYTKKKNNLHSGQLCSI